MHTYTHRSPPLIVPCSLLGDTLCAICSLCPVCVPLPHPPALCWVGLTICVPEGYHRKRTWLHANVHKHIYIHSLHVWSLAVLLCLVVLTKVLNAGNTFTFTFTFMHLADAFIQSDLQLHSDYTFLLVHVFPGNRTHNLSLSWHNVLPLSHTGTHVCSCEQWAIILLVIYE